MYPCENRSFRKTLYLMWVSDWCLNQCEQFFSYIMARTRYIWWDDDVHFVLDQHTYLDFYSVSSLKKSFSWLTCCSALIHYPDSEPTNLCSPVCRMLREKQQIPILKFLGWLKCWQRMLDHLPTSPSNESQWFLSIPKWCQCAR